MEDSKEILIRSLRNLGVNISPHITSIKDLDSSSFFSITSQSLHLLLHSTGTSSFPTSLPEPIAEKFLYPSEEDLHKLVRFLVERLSELSESKRTVNIVDNVSLSNAQLISRTWSEKNDEAEPLVYLNNDKLRAGMHAVRSERDVQEPVSNSAKVPSVGTNLVYEKLDKSATTGRVDEKETVAYMGDLVKKAAQFEDTAFGTETCKPDQESIACKESSPKLRCEVESICGQGTGEATGKDLKLHLLEEEHELLKEAVRMALDNEHSFSSYVEQLGEQIDTRNRNLQELENQWDIDRKSLEEKKWNLLESLCLSKPGCWPKLQKLKEIDTEIHSVLSEIRKREEECAKHADDLKQQPNGASRRSYIERITEITKNSRKLDTDIERILKETRELKIESNSIEERLHRTYAVVDETILREAKKDPVGRQAYRLLTNIHESFEKIRDQILTADKAQREVAELEVKLTAISSRNLDKDKLQADLNALRRENEHLEKTIMNC